MMIRPCVFLLLLTFYFGTLDAQDKPPFTSMDVFELEWVSDPQISPDGDYIVYERKSMDIMEDKRVSRIWMIKADGTEHQKLSSNDVSESKPRWSPDGTRIAFVSSTEEGSELFVYWLKTNKIARLSQLENSPANLAWSPDGKQIAFTKFVDGSELSLVKGPTKPKDAKWADAPRITSRVKHERDGSGKMKPGFTHIFVIPAEGGTARQVTSGNFNHGEPTWSKDGKDLFFSANLNEDWEYDFRNSELYKTSLANGKTKALTDRKGPDFGIAISPDGKRLAYLGYDDKVQTYQLTKLYTIGVDGKNKQEVKLNLDRSVSDLVWASDGKGIYFDYDDKGNTKIGYTAFDGQAKKMADNLGGTTVARPYGGGSFSLSKNGVLAFTHTTPYHPAELAIHQNGKTKLVMSLNDDLLKHRTLGQVEEIWYKSTFDNRDIQGWIVKPPFFDASNKYPLLVENHGGPISNYGDRFSPEIQLYATAGYIVFYPNPRGSTGYGEEFGNLLYHNYPSEDYNDVMDGVDAILKKGYTTEDSLFVTGGSAGGIMSAWMIGKTNRFRSAAVIKPVMNWISKTLTADNYYGYAYSRYPGQPWENYQDYWKFSPISLVGNIETPTLVMVGTNDMRTPLSEAKQLYHALKLRKIDTALIEMPGASHFIANRPSQLIGKVEHILAWFERER
ncbi:MAG: dipeptidyl aminopeptidase/acylaminoacyl peptidase [Saprospiraceae bacterium]|jgi:dipeptidyl aminopeptidase/acylaminoacyl peptidase